MQLWDKGGDAISLTGQEAVQQPHGAQGWGIGSSIHSLIYWNILAFREAWPNEGELSELVETQKSIQEVRQILRELEMRQEIYAPVFKAPDQAIFTADMKAKILQCALTAGMGC